MIKFRSRLLFALIFLIFTVLIGLGILLGQLFQAYFVQSFDERMIKEAQFLASEIEERGMEQIDSEQLNKASELLSVRITVLGKHFEPLFDSLHPDVSVSDPFMVTLKDAIKNNNNKENVAHKVTISRVHYYWEEVKVNERTDGYIFISSALTGIHSAYNQIWTILAISLGVALLIIILLGVRITARYTKPLESASNVAIELAKGNYHVRTYEHYGDETGILSSSLNVLARNLQNMVKEHEVQKDRLTTLIENMGSGLVLIDSKGYITLTNRTYKEVFHVQDHLFLGQLYMDVISHKEVCDVIEEVFMTEQKVRKQVHLSFPIERKHFEVYGAPIISQGNEWKGIVLVFHDITELKKLEQMRKDFVANVSHELKTPITSIKGFAETLLDGALQDRKTLESFLTIILKESERLQSLIHDLLELSKIEQHNFQLNMGQIELNELVTDSVEILKEKATRKEIHLSIQTSDNQIFIKGDASRLKQIFINIIDNAIAYTPNEGNISVKIMDSEKEAKVSVSDTGIGIEKGEIPRIFERFYRVDRARSRESGGTGLGLAIVKHLMEAHQGEISVESEVGKGTTFHLTFFKHV